MWATCERQAKKMWLILSLSFFFLPPSSLLHQTGINKRSGRNDVLQVHREVHPGRARLTFTDKFLPDRSAFVSRTRPRLVFSGAIFLSIPPIPAPLFHLLRQRGADEVASRGIKFAGRNYLHD